MNIPRPAFWLLILAALVLLHGCTVKSGRVPAEPGKALPANYAEATEAAAGGRPEIGRWWERFADARLNNMVTETLAHNLDLVQAQARLARFEAEARLTEADRGPFLNLAMQAGRERQIGTAGFGPATGSNYRLSLAAGYELDLWRKLKQQSVAAGFDVLASREDVKTLYLSLTAQVVDLYYFAVEQRAQMAMTETIIASFADTLARVEDRYAAGQAPALDVYQARQNLAAARTRLPVFEANLATARHALAILAGRFPTRELSGELATLPPAPAAFPAGLPSELLARRPDIKAAMLRVKAGDARVAAALAARFPAFNLLGSYGLARIDLGSVVSGTFWSLLAEVTQAVWDGGRRQAEVERRAALLREGMGKYQQTVLGAFQEVEDALSNNRTTERLLVLQDEHLAATEADLALATEGYFSGLNDYLAVLTAQRRNLEARGQLLSTKRRLIADRISLLRALGGDWLTAAGGSAE